MQRVCRLSMAFIRLCLVLLFTETVTAFPMPLPLSEVHPDQDSDEDGRLVDDAYRKIVGDDSLEASLAQEYTDFPNHFDVDQHRNVPAYVFMEEDDEIPKQLNMEDIPQGDQPADELVKTTEQVEDSPRQDGDLEISYQEDQPVKSLAEEGQQVENLPQGDQPFEDLPQGDMPMGGPMDENQAQDLETTSAPSMPINNSAAALRILKRKLQTEMIRLRVWNYTRPNTEYSSSTMENKTFVFPQKALDIVNSFSSGSISDSYNTERRSLFPSCDIPKNTDEELWVNGENSFSMNLLFNFNHSNLANGGREVLNATLRLYKIAQHIPLPLVSSCASPNASGNANGSGSRLSPTSERPALVESEESSETIRHNTDRHVRVSVYLYTRALKKNRVKRKRLDSRMISLNNDEWTAWNVSVAVKVYLESRRNFGLLVEVEDEHRCLLPANRIFKNINCSEEAATARPMPFLFMAANRERRPASGNAFTFNENFYPLMDVITASPNEENAFLSVGTSFPIDIPSLSESEHSTSPQHIRQRISERVHNGHQSPETPPLQDTHRHRHGDDAQGNHRRRRKPVNNTDESMDLRSLIIPQRIVMTAEQHRQALEQR